MHKHSVTINDQVFTRNSERHVYTHAVAAVHKPSGWPVVLNWCGSVELAAKKVSKCQTYPHYINVQAVPNGGAASI